MDECRLGDETTVARESTRLSSAPLPESEPAGKTSGAATFEEARQNVSAAAADSAAEALPKAGQAASAAATAQEVEQEEQGFVATPLKQEGVASSDAHMDAVPAAAAVHVQKVKDQAMQIPSDPVEAAAGTAGIDDEPDENVDLRNAQKAEETGNLRQVTGSPPAIQCFMKVPSGKSQLSVIVTQLTFARPVISLFSAYRQHEPNTTVCQ